MKQMDHYESYESRRAEWLRANGYRPDITLKVGLRFGEVVPLLDHCFVAVRADTGRHVVFGDPYDFGKIKNELDLRDIEHRHGMKIYQHRGLWMPGNTTLLEFEVDDPSRATFEYAATVVDMFKVAGWHSGAIDGRHQLRMWPCNPRRPAEIHRDCDCQRIAKNHKRFVCATLDLREAAVEVQVGSRVELYSDLGDLFVRVLSLADAGYGKLSGDDEVQRVALRIETRQRKVEIN